MSFDIKDFVEQISNEKIDSRLKRTSRIHPTQRLERIFCVVCGKPKGWVTQESYATIQARNIVAICDDCHSSFGSLPLPEASVEEVPAKE